MTEISRPTAARAAENISETESAGGHPPRLAGSADILQELEYALQRCRFAGDMRRAKLLFLAGYTRFSKHPVSVIIKGPSSGGKSFLLNLVLKFFPSSAYEVLTGLSQRAIVYWSADLRHKHLVIQEASGLQGREGNWMLRTLLSEGKVRYTVTVRPESGGRSEASTIEKDGPTGLFMTTTANRLHFEDETRALSFTVSDTPDQIRRTLAEQAGAFTESGEDAVDFEEWHALGHWIAANSHRVVVPYAHKLAGLVNATAHRVRRDFNHVLNLISAHARLHRLSRTCLPNGVVTADIADYQVVHGLVADIVAETAQATVRPEVRETVEAVARLLGEMRAQQPESEPLHVSVTDIAETLDIDKSSASRRVYAATEQGYLVNDEERRGRPALIRLGEPLPSDAQVLPEPDALRQALEARAAAEPPLG